MADDAGRATRTAIMMIDGAIGSLVGEGYDRKRDRIVIIQDEERVLPMWVSIAGRRVFRVDFERLDGKLVLQGSWIARPSLWTRLRRMFRRA